MKLIFKIILKIFKIIFLFILAAMALGGIFTVLLAGIRGTQAAIFLMYSLVVALTAFLYVFIDFKLKSSVIFLAVLGVYLWLLDGMPAVKYAFDLDMCYDDGICAENIEINYTGYGKILITRENCFRYGWIWDEEKRFCNIR